MARIKTNKEQVAQAQAAAPTSSPAANGKPAKCPVTREQFRSKAQPALSVAINGIPLVAVRKEFSTGSLGWNLNGKTVVEVDGVPCTVQIGLNVTIAHSKELPA